MAQVSAAMVKELREMTGAGMLECKKALTEADGDIDGAVDILRTRGLAQAAKKAGRATHEGRVCAVVDGKVGAVCQVNCETDFVALTDKFQGYAEKFTAAVVANDPADVEALLESEYEGAKLQDELTEAIHIIDISRGQRFMRHKRDRHQAAFKTFCQFLSPFRINLPQLFGKLRRDRSRCLKPFHQLPGDMLGIRR